MPEQKENLDQQIWREKQKFFEAAKKSENPLEKYPNPLRPAYPTNNRMFSAAQGLTKREYFAALAMQGLVMKEGFFPGIPEHPNFKQMIAEASIIIADELIKQLDENQNL